MGDRLLDTDVLIDTLRGAVGAGRRLAMAARIDRLFTSTITLFELERTEKIDSARPAIRRLLEDFRILPFDYRCAVEAAGIDRELRTRGLRLEVRDTLIAGTALAHGMELVTRNRRHFERVPGLMVSEL